MGLRARVNAEDMSRTPKPVPSFLKSYFFTAAEARTYGFHRTALRSSRFSRPFPGVWKYQDSAQSPTGLGHELHLVAAYSRLLRDGELFSHSSALLLHGSPIRCAPTVHITTMGPHARAQRDGVFAHHHSKNFPLPRATFLQHAAVPHSIPVVPLWIALAQSALYLPMIELIVSIDFAASPNLSKSAGRKALDLEAFRRWSVSHRYSGIRRLRAALGLAAAGADSRKETETRLLLWKLGITEFELQVDIYDRQGNWIGRFDLVDRTRRLIIEYDGEQHRLDPQQYRKDEERLERARAAGWKILRLRKEDLYTLNERRTRARILQFVGVTSRPPASRLLQLFEEEPSDRSMWAKRPQFAL